MKSVVKKQLARFVISCTLALLISAATVSAQTAAVYAYVNPKPDSKYVSVKSNILIRPGAVISKSSLHDDLIQVTGSKSGVHKGSLKLANDSKTIIFNPQTFFSQDETVSVEVEEGLLSANGVKISGVGFKFHTCKNPGQTDSVLPGNALQNQIRKSNASSAQNIFTMPADFPSLIINKSNNPSSGYLFLSFSPYLMIQDNEGIPVFYRNVNGTIYDFKLQPNGELTYFIYPGYCYGLDSNLNAVNTYNTTDGFTADVHDLRLIPGGGYYMFGKRLVQMDMSQIVQNGRTDAQIIDGALQEFDSSGNLVFEWDALEHYDITDIDDDDALLDYQIDFSHFNTIEPDGDGALLVSARNLDEITKIDHNTGEIIWRFGGKKNQFTMINDNIGFSRQHDVKRFSNGNISLFDNGNYHDVVISSAVEYRLDEVNKTATLVNRYTHNGTIFSPAEGSVQELPNGNRLIGWGNIFQPAVTEINSGNEIVYELSVSKSADEYRAFRFKWQTGLFNTNIDTLDFGKIDAGSSVTKSIVVYNPHDSLLVINELYCKENAFLTNIPVPVYVQPHDSVIIPVEFKPDSNKIYKASLNLQNYSLYGGYPQLIARQVILTGTTTGAASVDGNSGLPLSFNIEQNYPNPFNPSTIIKYDVAKQGAVKVSIYDILGREVKTLVDEEKKAGRYSIQFNASTLSSGIYFYTLRAPGFQQTKKMTLLK